VTLELKTHEVYRGYLDEVRKANWFVFVLTRKKKKKKKLGRRQLEHALDEFGANISRWQSDSFGTRLRARIADSICYFARFVRSICVAS
jgi:hypothetical protein